MATRILYENYLKEDLLTSITASSEATGFDVENVFTEKRRSKTWRSGVYYEITTLNRSIVFREGAGISRTANIAIGNYTTLASLLTAIETSLNSAGGSATYAATTFGPSNLVRLTSNGVGGDFRVTYSLSSILPVLGFLIEDFATEGVEYTASNITNYPAQWVRFDLGISSRPNAFVIIGKRNEPIQISPNAIVTLQGNETDAWTSPSFQQTVSMNDRALLLFSPNEAGFHTEALRYWRIKIQDPTNTKNYVEISSVFLGKYFEPSRGRVQIPWSSNYIDLTNTVYSESGNSFSNIRAKTDSFTMDWFGLTVSEKEKFDYIFDIYGIGIPFFVALDPMSAMSSSQHYYLRYIKLTDPPFLSLESPGNFAMSMECREEI